MPTPVSAHSLAAEITKLFGQDDIIRVSIVVDFDENEVYASLKLLLNDEIVQKFLHLFSDGKWKEKE